MKFFRNLLPLLLLAALGCINPYINADEQDGTSYDEELNERDFEALREFINSKKTIDLKEKANNLAISGDVRTEWRHMTETLDGHRLRGPGARFIFPESVQGNNEEIYDKGERFPVSKNDFDIEFNLHFEYRYKHTWAVGHVQYDNSAGIDDYGLNCNEDPKGWHGSGNAERLNLKQAYIGYNLFLCGDTVLDVELGRRGNLYKIFDSKVQFLSRLDGILLKYKTKWDCLGDWYVFLAGFVVDERVNQFAWVMETGFVNICDSGVDVKYSFIDWRRNGPNRCFENNPRGFRFMNSQLTMIYTLKQEILCKQARIFGAFVYNHDATHDGFKFERRNKNNSKHRVPKFFKDTPLDNVAWYIGFRVGDVRKEGDWAFEAQYQYVEAKAVPEGDSSGIGLGNIRDDTFTSNGRGNTNFKGYRFEGLYALTDNLTIDSIVEFSRTIRSSIAGKHTYSKFELEAIYAF